ncbi:GGDEF domain-containing protein [Aliarcobacter cryaerophilus]|mgnify:FL=1|jgi:two-component system, cell cycle response regulator|uniref:diguanylate cyclase n=3 Tax=Arcobacteraceae TaxID=2808963 RepID=A0AAU0P4G3_9BACT|nr:GGDEF domain-containing protein [Aliarcobacter cryaerophilus]WNL17856.1 GGDEF domain-containing protein [Arcobacter sp. AZ-2023]WPD02831.1 GGDEF domain-containing protein [Arcobacter sp. DSM 115972]MCT7467320.1 GGDEF domain-containing protein [Aliarcobacter cryaerophilus]MCT7471977.1 GGDEF domain-containing protein [Aliarcobacter cryaerophilus]MCT7533969.1 GGDEF domain-containing protein [Aliarcobacter cryaerophilus]
MRNSIIELIKQSASDKVAFETLDSIFKLYEQLQYSSNLNQLASDIFLWLEEEFAIKNMVFSLFDINKNNKTDILAKGDKFYLDDDLSQFFIINTHTNLNATISFCASSEEHSLFLENKYNSIEATFFIISTIVQNAILKKNFIDSASLDSVTNVFSSHYFIENLSSYLKLSNNKQNEIFLLMIGIDRFKAVVDEFNYEIADKVLIELARVIHSNINEFDIVGRLETDTFLVSILSNDDENQACEVAKKIISDFSKARVIVNEETRQTLQKTVSIGFEKFVLNSNMSLDDAIKNADIALVEAKNRGRGEFLKFSKINSSDNFKLF